MRPSFFAIFNWFWPELKQLNLSFNIRHRYMLYWFIFNLNLNRHCHLLIDLNSNINFNRQSTLPFVHLFKFYNLNLNLNWHCRLLIDLNSIISIWISNGIIDLMRQCRLIWNSISNYNSINGNAVFKKTVPIVLKCCLLIWTHLSHLTNIFQKKYIRLEIITYYLKKA